MGLSIPVILQIPIPTLNPNLSPTPFVVQTDNDTLNLLLAFRENNGVGFAVGLVISLTGLMVVVKFFTAVVNILKLETLFDFEDSDLPPLKVEDALRSDEVVNNRIIELQQSVIELQAEMLKLKGK